MFKSCNSLVDISQLNISLKTKNNPHIIKIQYKNDLSNELLNIACLSIHTRTILDYLNSFTLL